MEWIKAFWYDWNIIEIVALAILAICVLIQLVYSLGIYSKLAGHKTQKTVPSKDPVSIIICAKNEEKNLRELIPLLMDQNHPQFQIVVVNDNSWDDSEETLKAFQISYPNLHVITLDEDKQWMQGKKFALTLGIKGAIHEKLLLTDADCRPNSKEWVSQMTGNLEGKNEICIGFSPHEKKKGLLNLLVRFETFTAGLNYLSFSLGKNTYMGVGRNLAYTKSVYNKNGGFKKHYHIISGDDDLFINQAATKDNVTVQINPLAFTTSEPKQRFSEWWHQKKRHFTTSPSYKFKHKFLLTLWPFSYYLMLISFVVCIVLHRPLLIASLVIGLRYAAQLVIFSMSMRRLEHRDLFWLSPILELTLWLIQPMIVISNFLWKPKQWK